MWKKRSHKKEVDAKNGLQSTMCLKHRSAVSERGVGVEGGVTHIGFNHLDNQEDASD